MFPIQDKFESVVEKATEQGQGQGKGISTQPIKSCSPNIQSRPFARPESFFRTTLKRSGWQCNDGAKGVAEGRVSTSRITLVSSLGIFLWYFVVLKGLIGFRVAPLLIVSVCWCILKGEVLMVAFAKQSIDSMIQQMFGNLWYYLDKRCIPCKLPTLWFNWKIL